MVFVGSGSSGSWPGSAPSSTSSQWTRAGEYLERVKALSTSSSSPRPSRRVDDVRCDLSVTWAPGSMMRACRRVPRAIKPPCRGRCRAGRDLWGATRRTIYERVHGGGHCVRGVRSWWGLRLAGHRTGGSGLAITVLIYTYAIKRVDYLATTDAVHHADVHVRRCVLPARGLRTGYARSRCVHAPISRPANLMRSL